MFSDYQHSKNMPVMQQKPILLPLCLTEYHDVGKRCDNLT